MNAKHTPTPGTIDYPPYDLGFDGKEHLIMTKNGKVIASFDKDQDLNASYFHLCVNVHDELMEALDFALSVIKDIGIDKNSGKISTKEKYDTINAILSKAKGE